MEGLKGKQYPTRSGGALSNQSNHSRERVQTGAHFARPAHSLLTGPLEPTCRPLPKMTILASASLAAASFWPATSFPIKPIRGGASYKTDGLIHICWRPWASGRARPPGAQPTVPLCWGAASHLSVSSPLSSPQASPPLAPAWGGNSTNGYLPQRPAVEPPVEPPRTAHSVSKGIFL